MAKRVARQQDVPGAAAARNPAPVRLAPLPEAPRNYAARGIAGLLAPVVRPVFTRRAPAAAQLLADWESLAGPALSRRAVPVKFAGGTLTLACAGPVALELQHNAPALIERLNLGLGRATVERLRFIAQAPGAVQTPVAAPRRREILPPDDLPQGELGSALAKLYKGIMSRSGP